MRSCTLLLCLCVPVTAFAQDAAAQRIADLEEQLRQQETVSGPKSDAAVATRVLLGQTLFAEGQARYDRQDLAQSRKSLEAALAHFTVAYPEERYSRGHERLAATLKLLAEVMHAHGEYGKSGELCRQALTMNRKLYPAAEFPDGHADLAASLIQMAFMEGGGPNAILLYQEALAMQRKLYPTDKFPRGQSELIYTLNQLGNALIGQRRIEEGLTHLEQAVALTRGPNQGISAATAMSLLYLGRAQAMTGRLREAERSFADATRIYRLGYPPDLFPRGHSSIVHGLDRCALMQHLQGKSDAAVESLLAAGEMSLNLATDFALAHSEAEALNYTVDYVEHPDLLISAWPHGGRPVDELYAYVWNYRGLIYRVQSRRQRAVAAAAGPEAARLYSEYVKLRQSLGNLMYAPLPADGSATAERRQLLAQHGEEKERLERQLAELAPLLAAEFQQQPSAADLVAAMPADAAFLDFLRVDLVPRSGVTGLADPKGPHYVAFLVQHDRPVELIVLGSAEAIDKQISQWRGEIDRGLATTNKPSAAALELKKLLFDSWSLGLAGGVKRIYFCPDGQLATVPWAALPGRGGGFLVEDFAFAAVPHGQALLHKVTPQPKAPEGGGKLLVVGDIDYGLAPDVASQRWNKLPGAAVEIAEVRALAGGRPIAALSRTDVRPERVLGELQQARYAHFATHGFFADRELRSVLQLDPGLFDAAAEQRSLRSGLAARSPLLLSALVLAGANLPGQDRGGLLFAESIAAQPLAKLDLAVLSACDTGLGDVAGGEGVFGLARAFHLAGTRNVVASLWKVDDAATAAQMRLFYHHLWHEKREPVDAMREAQLALLKRPDLVPQLATQRGINFTKAVELTKARPAEPGQTPVRLWAAFVVSTAQP